jgi:hypothetical protein
MGLGMGGDLVNPSPSPNPLIYLLILIPAGYLDFLGMGGECGVLNLLIKPKLYFCMDIVTQVKLVLF